MGVCFLAASFTRDVDAETFMMEELPVRHLICYKRCNMRHMMESNDFVHEM